MMMITHSCADERRFFSHTRFCSVSCGAEETHGTYAQHLRTTYALLTRTPTTQMLYKFLGFSVWGNLRGEIMCKKGGGEMGKHFFFG